MEFKRDPDKEYFQNVHFTLDDGRKVVATVRAFLFPGEREPLVTEMQIGQPQEVPDGCNLLNFDLKEG